MKRIPVKKHSILIVAIAFITASALLGSALFLPDSGRSSASGIHRTEKISDRADNPPAENDSQEEMENVSTDNGNSAEESSQPGSSSPEQTPPSAGSGQTDSGIGNSIPKSSDSSAGDQQKPAVQPSVPSDDSSARYAYLTFDDGPSRNTDAILKILAENDIKATFFVTARNTDETNMQRYRKIAEAGHTLAMHSGTHNYREIYASKEAFLADYSRISDLLYEITGTRSVIYRFPGGSSNTVSAKYCPGIMTNLVQKLTDDGMMYVDWNVSSGDASGKRLTPAQIAANVRGGLKHGRGNIVLMHDTSAKKTTADAVQSMIDGAKADGYAFYPITADTVPVHQGIRN